MKIYQVFHDFDVDGGFGDAVRQTALLETFENEDDANAFAQRLNNPHVYDTPYSDLWCGNVYVKSVDIVDHSGFKPENIDVGKYWWTDKYNSEDCQLKRSIEADWFDFYNNINIDDDARITKEYWCRTADISYPVGTPVQEIERWFEENYDGGIVALQEFSDVYI